MTTRRGGDPPQRLRYSKTSAAAALDISVRKLDELRAEGAIFCRFDKGHVFFDHEELVAYRDSLPSERP